MGLWEPKFLDALASVASKLSVREAVHIKKSREAVDIFRTGKKQKKWYGMPSLKLLDKSEQLVNNVNYLQHGNMIQGQEALDDMYIDVVTTSVHCGMGSVHKKKKKKFTSTLL